MSNTRDEISALMARAVRTGETYVLPMLEAVRDGRIILKAMTDRAETAPMHSLKVWAAQKPTLILIADDGGFPTGPNTWACANAVMKWCGGCMINASGGEAAHYDLAVRAAEEFRRFVLIETGTAHLRGWRSLAEKANKPTLFVVPKDGQPHPVMPNRRGMH